MTTVLPGMLSRLVSTRSTRQCRRDWHWELEIKQVITIHDLLPLRYPEATIQSMHYYFRSCSSLPSSGVQCALSAILMPHIVISSRCLGSPGALCRSFRPVIDSGCFINALAMNVVGRLPGPPTSCTSETCDHTRTWMQHYGHLLPIGRTRVAVRDCRQQGNERQRSSRRAGVESGHQLTVWSSRDSFPMRSWRDLYAALWHLSFRRSGRDSDFRPWRRWRADVQSSRRTSRLSRRCVATRSSTLTPRRVESIRGAMERIIREPALREDLRGRGLERAKLFSWDRTAREVWQVLESVRQ